MFTGVSNPNADSSRPSFGTYLPSSLESSTELQLLYSRYPQLQDQLKEIYEAATEPLKDPPKDQSFSSERSHKGRGGGGNRGQARDGKTIATRSRHNGIKSGIHRFRMLRRPKGEDGDGLREFSKLVTGSLESRKSKIIAPQAY